ncbi:MAG: hypothetical protein ACRC7R_08030, partial [Sarcina sp.]
MCNFRNFLYDLNKNTNIPFKIVLEDSVSLVNYLKSDDFLIKEILLGNKKAKLLVDSEFQGCTSLLKYSIENKYRETYFKREELIKNVLENKILLSEEINQIDLILHDFNTLFLILAEKNRCEILSVLKEVYNKKE